MHLKLEQNIHAKKGCKYKIWQTYFEYISVALFYDNATRCREVVFKLANESKWKLLSILLNKIFWTCWIWRYFLEIGTFLKAHLHLWKRIFTKVQLELKSTINWYHQSPSCPKNDQNQPWIWVKLSPFRALQEDKLMQLIGSTLLFKLSKGN